MGMTKSEVKKALDEIRDMNDDEIAINGIFIRKTAEEAFALIKNLERKRIRNDYRKSREAVERVS